MPSLFSGQEMDGQKADGGNPKGLMNYNYSISRVTVRVPPNICITSLYVLCIVTDGVSYGNETKALD